MDNFDDGRYSEENEELNALISQGFVIEDTALEFELKYQYKNGVENCRHIFDTELIELYQQRGVLNDSDIKALQEALDEYRSATDVKVVKERVVPSRLLIEKGSELTLQQLFNLRHPYYIYNFELKRNVLPEPGSTYLSSIESKLQEHPRVDYIEKSLTGCQMVYDQIAINLMNGFINQAEIITFFTSNTEVTPLDVEKMITGLEHVRDSIIETFDEHSDASGINLLGDLVDQFMYIQDTISRLTAYRSVYYSVSGRIKNYIPFPIGTYKTPESKFLPIEILPFLPVLFEDFLDYLVYFKNMRYGAEKAVSYGGTTVLHRIIYQDRSRKSDIFQIAQNIISRNATRGMSEDVRESLITKLIKNTNLLSAKFLKIDGDQFVLDIPTPGREYRYMVSAEAKRPRVTPRFNFREE